MVLDGVVVGLDAAGFRGKRTIKTGRFFIKATFWQQFGCNVSLHRFGRIGSDQDRFFILKKEKGKVDA